MLATCGFFDPSCRGKVAEHSVHERDHLLFVEGTDHGNAEVVAGDQTFMGIDEISTADRFNALQRAAIGQAVDVAGKGLGEESLRRAHAGIVHLVSDAGERLCAHAGDRLVIETRLHEGEARECNGLVKIASQGAQAAGNGILTGTERKLDG